MSQDNTTVIKQKRTRKSKNGTVPETITTGTYIEIPAPVSTEGLATSSVKIGTGSFSQPKRKKIIKRKPGSTAVYFSADTERSIVKYQNEPDIKKKNEVYIKEILPAYDSLVENLINVYGFKIMYETKKDLKQECLEFLFKVTGKFDVTKGSKAFSYFNVVAKHWLTIKSKQNVKRVKTYISSDDRDNMSSSDIDLFESNNVYPSFEEILNQHEKSKILKTTVIKMRDKIKTENEIICLDAVEQLMLSLEDIEILNKRAILMYLKNISGLSSKQLSIVLSSLKKKYKDIKRNMD